MLRTFINERNKWDEVMQIDTVTGEVRTYCVEKELGFPFAENNTSFVKLGYKSVDEMIQQIVSRKTEIDTKTQLERERVGIEKLKAKLEEVRK